MTNKKINIDQFQLNRIWVVLFRIQVHEKCKKNYISLKWNFSAVKASFLM